jgi:hypothetical protein
MSDDARRRILHALGLLAEIRRGVESAAIVRVASHRRVLEEELGRLGTITDDRAATIADLARVSRAIGDADRGDASSTDPLGDGGPMDHSTEAKEALVIRRLRHLDHLREIETRARVRVEGAEASWKAALEGFLAARSHREFIESDRDRISGAIAKDADAAADRASSDARIAVASEESWFDTDS